MTEGMSKRLPRRLVFADVECSGLADSVEEIIAADHLEVIEYAFAIWEDGEVKTKLVRKVYPCHKDALAAAEECAEKGYNHFDRNNWTNQPVGSGQEYRQADFWCAIDREHVKAFLQGERLAGSNPAFDLRFLKGMFAKHNEMAVFPTLADHRMCDLNGLAWPLWALRLVEKTGLEHSAALFGIEHKKHTAMGDVEASIAVWERYCEHYIWRPRDMRELLEALPGVLDEAKRPAVAKWLRGELKKLDVL